MPAAALPAKETDRLLAVRALALLDTLPESCFDDLTVLAAAICDAPIALISLVDEKRQWLKSEIGAGFREAPRELTFCSHAIHQMDLFLVEDASKDPRFADFPVVKGAQQIRFYAGVPLDSAGYKVGTLCVLDRTPRKLTAKQLEALRVLGRQVEALLTLRLKTRELLERDAKLLRVRRQKDERSALLLHDLKNPLASIMLNAHLLEQEKPNEIVRDIVDSAEGMRRMVGNMVDISRSEDGTMRPRLAVVRVRSILDQVCGGHARRARQSGKTLEVLAPDDLRVRADAELLRRVCDNLLDNAVKYAAPGPVCVTGKAVEGGVEMRVEDTGPGIPLAARAQIFDKYAQLGAAGSGGLGLTFCRLAAQAHGGSIRVEASPLGGSAFVLTLPAR